MHAEYVTAVAIQGTKGGVGGVTSDILPADVVVCAVGAIPNVEVMKEAGCRLSTSTGCSEWVDLGVGGQSSSPGKGGVEVNDQFQTTGGDGLFCCGDMAVYEGRRYGTFDG